MTREKKKKFLTGKNKLTKSRMISARNVQRKCERYYETKFYPGKWYFWQINDFSFVAVCVQDIFTRMKTTSNMVLFDFRMNNSIQGYGKLIKKMAFVGFCTRFWNEPTDYLCESNNIIFEKIGSRLTWKIRVRKMFTWK